MPETTPLIKAALNLRVGAGFDVYGGLGFNRKLNEILHKKAAMIFTNHYCLTNVPCGNRTHN